MRSRVHASWQVVDIVGWLSWTRWCIGHMGVTGTCYCSQQCCNGDADMGIRRVPLKAWCVHRLFGWPYQSVLLAGPACVSSELYCSRHVATRVFLLRGNESAVTAHPGTCHDQGADAVPFPCGCKCINVTKQCSARSRLVPCHSEEDGGKVQMMGVGDHTVPSRQSRHKLWDTQLYQNWCAC